MGESAVRLLLGWVLVGVHAVAFPSEQVERGAYLVETIAACGTCHSPRDENNIAVAGKALSGRLMTDNPDATVYAANITPDRNTGIGAWTDDQIIRAIREGIRPDGSVLGPVMPFNLYRQISDTDARAIVAYLKSVPPVDHTVPRSEYRVPLPADYGPALTSVAEPDHSDPVAYGAYLAGPLGHCIKCHTPTAEERVGDYRRIGAGGNIYKPGGMVTVSANITPNKQHGIGDWTDDEIKTAIARGVGRDGTTILPMMNERPYEGLTDTDLDALVSYLRSLAPWPR